MSAVALKEANRRQLTEALREIAAAHDGRLIAEDVVDAARDPDSPLHDHFEWDDEKAGDAFRLIQAGMLIRRIKVHVMRDDGDGAAKMMTVRSLVSLPEARANRAGYESIDTVLGDKRKREELLAQALKDMEALQRRYDNLTELSEVWGAMKRVRRRAAPTVAAAEAR